VHRRRLTPEADRGTKALDQSEGSATEIRLVLMFYYIQLLVSGNIEANVGAGKTAMVISRYLWTVTAECVIEDELLSHKLAD